MIDYFAIIVNFVKFNNLENEKKKLILPFGKSIFHNLKNY